MLLNTKQFTKCQSVNISNVIFFERLISNFWKLQELKCNFYFKCMLIKQGASYQVCIYFFLFYSH